MRKVAILSLLFVVFGISGFAQWRSYPNVVREKFGIVSVKQPLILIGHFETDYHSFLIHPDNLKIIKTYTDSLELVPFGVKGQNGIVLAELNMKVPLFKLEDVFDYFKIPAENRKLKVLVDNRLINPELFLADISLIKSIEVTKQDLTSTLRYSWKEDEAFLHIFTTLKK